MELVIKKDHVLFINNSGKYHLDLDKFEELGEAGAIKLAESEIKKKAKLGQYQELDIDFSRAIDLGFCEYGINDFCDRLELDSTQTYNIEFLFKQLTVSAFLEYPSECFKLFGRDVFERFGGAKNLLSENKTQNLMNLVIEHVLSENDCHLLACEFAKKNLEKFENEFPEDKRPRLAIEAKEKFVKGEITKEELSAARSAARSAAWSAESAARSAESAAKSAARSAAWSAAKSAESAAKSAARSAAIEWQCEQVLKRL